LIEAIRQGLQSFEEVPYRDGAWEDFRSNHPVAVRPKTTYAFYWASAAAVALLLMFGVLYRDGFRGGTETDGPEQGALADLPEIPPTNPPVAPDADGPAIFAETPTAPLPQADGFPAAETLRKALIPKRENTSAVVLSATLSADGKTASDMLIGRFETVRSKTEHAIAKPVFAALDIRNQPVMAQKAVPNTVGLSASMRPFSPAKKRLTERLEIGAFLSPGTTGDNFDMGGGLLLGYRLSGRLSLRTGASFNQYEVGALASRPADGVRTEEVMDAPTADENAGMFADNIPYRASSVLMPNLDAVSGKVQTLDVPVELKYHFDARFYAVAGVSYAAVLSQERYNHYREYVDPVTYSSGSDSGRPVEQNPTAVETVLKTSDENVRANGFGGFINLSIGRRTDLSKTFKLLVEPYVKIPIGRFKRADMDYTNGGMKIIVMTN